MVDFCCTGTALAFTGDIYVTGPVWRSSINMTINLFLSISIITMDSLSIADNTTVVAGPSSVVDRKDISHYQSDSSKSQPSQHHKRAANDFVRAVDYTMENRQFFVPVGHDGLISALQKLDQELQNVS